MPLPVVRRLKSTRSMAKAMVPEQPATEIGQEGSRSEDGREERKTSE